MFHSIRSRMLFIAAAVALVLGALVPGGPAGAEQVVSRNCGGTYLAWAEYRDYGDNIKMRLKPTKLAWAVMGGGSLTSQLWDSYFRCIPWDDGFGRLSKRQWDSLWLQHRCHEVLGAIGRYKSGDTFDYESWVPFRGDLRTALNNGCN